MSTALAIVHMSFDLCSSCSLRSLCTTNQKCVRLIMLPLPSDTKWHLLSQCWQLHMFNWNVPKVVIHKMNNCHPLWGEYSYSSHSFVQSQWFFKRETYPDTPVAWNSHAELPTVVCIVSVWNNWSPARWWPLKVHFLSSLIWTTKGCSYGICLEELTFLDMRTAV